MCVFCYEMNLNWYLSFCGATREGRAYGPRINKVSKSTT